MPVDEFLIIWEVAWLPILLYLFVKISGITDFIKWYKEYKKEKENKQ